MKTQSWWIEEKRQVNRRAGKKSRSSSLSCCWVHVEVHLTNFFNEYDCMCMWSETACIGGYQSNRGVCVDALLWRPILSTSCYWWYFAPAACMLTTIYGALTSTIGFRFSGKVGELWHVGHFQPNSWNSFFPKRRSKRKGWRLNVETTDRSRWIVRQGKPLVGMPSGDPARWTSECWPFS
jgi:hypothetical protein